MKNQLCKMVYLGLLLTVLSTLISCEKMLEESPKSIISPNVFFTTEAQCIQATNGVYSSLTTIFGDESLWALTFSGTDLFLFNGGSATIKSYQDYTFSASASAPSYTTWNRCYEGIKNANMVISKVEKSPIDPSAKLRLIGEAKYLRALYYYLLTNVFGDVPLWTNELDVSEISKLSRTPLNEVRTQIINDLLAAEKGLSWTVTAANVGRVTKGAALGLLAKVYLFNKEWKNAADIAERIVKEGPYVLLNYDEIFSETNKNKNNKESVFEIQYSRNSATGQNFIVNHFYTWFFPTRDGTTATYAGVNFGTTDLESYPEFYPTTKLANLYEPGDKRKDFVIANGYNGQQFKSFPRHLIDLKKQYPWFGPKFWDLTALKRASEKNLYFMRFGEIILIYAEALNELNRTPEAITQLDKIRNRAKLSKLPAKPQNEVRQYIMDERARELVGEFQRKWDLMRWGNLVETISAIKNDNPIGAQNVKEYHNFFPIPYDEIVKNPNLHQNDGY